MKAKYHHADRVKYKCLYGSFREPVNIRLGVFNIKANTISRNQPYYVAGEEEQPIRSYPISRYAAEVGQEYDVHPI